MLEFLAADVKHSWRLLQKKPGFAVVVISILAIGIGINSAVFSLVNAILFKPIPAKDPDHLVRLYKTSAGSPPSQQISYADFVEYQRLDHSFSGAAAVHMAPTTMRGALERSDQQILAEVVSGNYFSVLGIEVIPGRSFEFPNSDSVVISHDLWVNKFSGRAGARRATLQEDRIVVNGRAFDIAGVAPEDFRGTFAGARIQVWIPLESSSGLLPPDWKQNRDRNLFQTIARLQPGISPGQAELEASGLSKELERIYPKTNRGEGISLAPATYLHGNLRNAAKAFLAVVMALVALVLLIACLNVANLMLARGLDRGKEMAIRRSLGANRFRLLSQLITESLFLAILGGIGGLVLSFWVSELLTGWNPIPFVPFRLDLTPDFRVFAFSFVISVVTGILIGIIPGIRASNQDVAPQLKESAEASFRIRWHLKVRDFIVVVQLATCLVLLIEVGLFGKSLINSINAEPGYDPARMFATDIDISSQKWSEEQGRQFYTQLLDQLNKVPTIESATLADRVPPDISTPFIRIALEGHSSPQGDPWIRISSTRVNGNYFEALKIPVLSGRAFGPMDRNDTRPVAVINRTMAEKFWPGENPVGKRFRLENNPEQTIEVIGVARNSRYRSLGEDPTPHVYLPFSQHYVASMSLLVRSRSALGTPMQDVQKTIQSLSPQTQGFFTRSIAEHIGFSLLPAKAASLLTAVFGGIALWIALIGIYAAVSFLVNSRSREIGIRAAMGASSRNIFRMFLRKGLILTLAGLVLGTLIALWLNRLLSAFLFGVSPYDRVIWIAVSILLASVAMLACSIPARRAAKFNPVVALRYE